MRQNQAARNVRVSIEIGNSAADVRQALLTARRSLELSAIGARHADTVETVLAEVLNNVVEHAYDHPDDHTIHLQIEVKDARVTCSVRDMGRALPGQCLPDLSQPILDLRRVDRLPEGGFGWGLIYDLTHSLEYARQAGENRLTFSITEPIEPIS